MAMGKEGACLMSAALPAFQLASDLGPSPSETEQLRDLCSRQAEQIERLEALAECPNPAPKSQAGTIRPEEKQALIQLLSDLREQAKEQAGEIEQHKREIERLKKEGEDLEKALKEAQQDIAWIQECFPPQIAEDRRRIAALESQAMPRTQRKQAVRAEVLLSLLASHGSKMLAEDARKRMGISKSAFSLLLRTISDKVNLKHYHLDRRKLVIILKSQN